MSWKGVKVTGLPSGVPKRYSNMQRDILRLYRAFLREARKKGALELVKAEFKRKQQRQDASMRDIEVWYRKGKAQLETLKRADKVTSIVITRD